MIRRRKKLCQLTIAKSSFDDGPLDLRVSTNRKYMKLTMYHLIYSTVDKLVNLDSCMMFHT